MTFEREIEGATSGVDFRLHGQKVHSDAFEFFRIDHFSAVSPQGTLEGLDSTISVSCLWQVGHCTNGTSHCMYAVNGA